jgi:glycosyltransferase involved in cell wall biosynthesis
VDKLRVAMIGGYPLDPHRINGGVQSATAYLVKGLARIEGLELHVLVFQPSNWTGPECFDRDGVFVHMMPSYPRFERLRGYTTYQSMCNKILRQIQPAIVHAQEATSAAYVAIHSHFPTIVTAHGICQEDRKYYNSLRRRLSSLYDSFVIEQYVMHNVRYLIAISPYIKTYFKNIMSTDQNIYMIPNAIDEKFFDLVDIEESEMTILYAGSLIPRKRVIDLVQAFQKVTCQVPQARLRLAGDIKSEPAYVELVRRAIREADLENKVTILGSLTDEQILHEFAKCNLVVLASSQETTPMTLAQAMAAGKPVVATCVGGVAQMVGKNGDRGLLVNPGDIDSLAEAMLRLLNNPLLAKSMGKAGHLYALENYHMSKVAQRTYEVYRTVTEAEASAHV